MRLEVGLVVGHDGRNASLGIAGVALLGLGLGHDKDLAMAGSLKRSRQTR